VQDRYEFDAEIEPAQGAAGKGGAWVRFPYDAKAEFGVASQVKVTATFDGHPYRGSLAPMGPPDGSGRRCHVLGITKAIRAAIGRDVGDSVHVVVQHDTAPRTVEPPADLQSALASDAAAEQAWSTLSYSHQREYARWIEEAKKPETRARRVGETVQKLLETKRR
jgi:hypothetical protein